MFLLHRLFFTTTKLRRAHAVTYNSPVYFTDNALVFYLPLGSRNMKRIWT